MVDTRYLIIDNDTQVGISNAEELCKLLSAGYTHKASWIAGTKVHHLLFREINRELPL